MLSTREFTAEELTQARGELDAIGVTSRHGGTANAFAVLGQLGAILLYASDRYPDDAELRGGASVYVVWRDLPAKDPAHPATDVEHDDAGCTTCNHGPVDTGYGYSRGDSEPPDVDIKPDTLLADMSDHHRDQAPPASGQNCPDCPDFVPDSLYHLRQHVADFHGVAMQEPADA